MRGLLLIAGSLSLLATSFGCRSAQQPAELALIYNPAAQYHGPDRNPIIAIPGILGSRLIDPVSGTLVWGAFEPGAADPADPAGARLIALPIERSQTLAASRDSVEPAGVLEQIRIRLLGIPIVIQAYAGILATLGAGGYRDSDLGLGGKIDYGDDHFTCFQFAYDWRRDNVENAQKLHAFIAEKRAYLQIEYERRYGIEDAEIRFDIVAHSMGGLLTRYFLMYGDQDLPADGSLPELKWSGAKWVERVIFVGTPSAGSLDAFVELVEGTKVGPLLPYYPSALMGSFPSVYQLLPRTRHRRVVWNADPARPVDLLDPAVWETMKWGLASPEQSGLLEILIPDVADAAVRHDIARDLQRRILERAETFMRAMDRPAPAPPGLIMYLVAGDSEPTPSLVAVDESTGEIEIRETGPGDGSVLRSSALLDERAGAAWSPRLETPIDFSQVLMLPAGHLALTRNDVFRDNVLYWLLEEPRRSGDCVAFSAPPGETDTPQSRSRFGDACRTSPRTRR